MLLVETLDENTFEVIDVELAVYKFQYLTEDDEHVFRIEDQEGHEGEEGTTHIHLPDKDPEPCAEVDLDDVLKLIAQHLSRNSD
jgi:hypothetical protein